MKLVIAVVQQPDADALVDHLTARGVRVTRISSEGGWLKESNVTLVIAADDDAITGILWSIQRHCSSRTRYVAPAAPHAEAGAYYPATPIEVEIGGATVFVVPIDQQLALL